MKRQIIIILALASTLLASCAPATVSSNNEQSFDSIVDISKVNLPAGYSFQPNGNTLINGDAGLLAISGGAVALNNPVGYIFAGGVAAWSLYAYSNPAEAERAAQDLAEGAYMVYMFTAMNFSTTINDILTETENLVVQQQVDNLKSTSDYLGGNIVFSTTSYYWCTNDTHGYQYKFQRVALPGGCPQPGDTKTLRQHIKELWKKAKSNGQYEMAEDIDMNSAKIYY